MGRNVLGKRPKKSFSSPSFIKTKQPKWVERYKIHWKIILQILKDNKEQWVERKKIREIFQPKISTLEIEFYIELLIKFDYVEARYEDKHWSHLFSKIKITLHGLNTLNKN